MAETTEQIVREAPDIEKYKLDLLETAELLSKKDLNLPAFQAAGLSDVQQQAINLGRSGIGAYAPFLQAGQRAMETGIGGLGQAAQAVGGVNVSPEYQQALGAMGMGLGATGAMSPYIGAMGAGTGLMGEAAGMARGASAADLRASQQMLGQAAGGTMGAMGGYNPQMAQAFMDPYQQQVTRNAVAEMARAADIQSQGMAARAAQAGAFGGTREGVERAEFGRGVQDIMSQRIAEDISRNYQQAQQAAMGSFEAQQQRQMAGSGQLAGIGGTLGQQAFSQAGLGQASAGLLGQLGQGIAGIYGQQAGLAGQQAGLYGQLGQGIGGLAMNYGQLGLQRGMAMSDVAQAMGRMGMDQAQMGELAQRANLGDVNALLTLGGLQQAAEQARLDAFRATEAQKAASPYQRVAFLSDIYKGAPSSQMSITAATAPSVSPLVQAAGLGIAGVSAASGAARAGLF